MDWQNLVSTVVDDIVVDVIGIEPLERVFAELYSIG